MTLLLGDVVRDFQAGTTTGPFSFQHWIGDDWAFFSAIPPTLLRSAPLKWAALRSWPTNFPSVA